MFQKVSEPSQIKSVVQLAQRIWPEHYRAIIGAAQVDYMLATYHSEAMISQQVQTQEYQYFLISQTQQPVGYFAYAVTSNELFLSKFYLLSEFRGVGLGRKAMAFITDYAKSQGCKKIRLTVNKDNHSSILAYQRLGFVQTKDVCADIGNGYVMDDHEMELVIGD